MIKEPTKKTMIVMIVLCLIVGAWRFIKGKR
jgi:hypothetical protein